MKKLFILLLIAGFSQLAIGQSISGLTHAVSATSGDLDVTWTAITAPAGNYEYELEWTYMSGVDANGAQIPTNTLDVPGLLFETNSSRVMVSKNSFSIPLIYEQGYVLYRVRAAWIDAYGALLHSDWSTDAPIVDGIKVVNSTMKLNAWNNGGVANYYYLTDGLEKNKNWQSSISFAEEGKTKTVVSYHDGSMRNRQAVTRINSDQRAIVGETFYDYNGRASLQLLPVPVPGNLLTYRNNFNIADGGTKLSKSDFELGDPTLVCNYKSPQFSTSNGASQYYSPNNSVNYFTEAQTPAQALGNKILNIGLIPDAGKYPYTQTMYTPDNTGRVKLQTGVGAAYNYNSGHFTRNMYGKPQQEELSRLFGTEVGFADHYKKNVVIDANGQPSVSYLDLDGKVIATTLAGGAPGALDPLTGIASRNIVSQLLTPQGNLLSADGSSKTFSSKILVTADNTQYDFAYKGTAVPFSIQCDKDGSGNRSFIGGLKLDYSLTDECGVKQFEVSKANSHITSTNSFNESNSVKLNQGEYLLTKTVSVDNELLDNEWNTFAADTTQNCLKTIRDFEHGYLGSISAAGCNISCESCLEGLKKVATDNPGLDPNALVLMQQLCDKLCQKVDPCDAAFQMMKGDMGPGGQYGEVRPKLFSNPLSSAPTYDAAQVALTKTGNAQDPATLNLNVDPDNGAAVAAMSTVDPRPFPLSIYNGDNQLPHITANGLDYTPSWKSPMKMIIDGNRNITFQPDGYYNIDGSPSTIPVFVQFNFSKDGFSHMNASKGWRRS